MIAGRGLKLFKKVGHKGLLGWGEGATLGEIGHFFLGNAIAGEDAPAIQKKPVQGHAETLAYFQHHGGAGQGFAPHPLANGLILHAEFVGDALLPAALVTKAG